MGLAVFGSKQPYRSSLRRPGPSPSAVVNGAAGMTIAALIIAALYAGRDLLIPLALAGLLSFILSPLVRRLSKWRLPHGLSVALVVSVVLAVFVVGISVAGQQVTQLLEDLPSHEENLRAKARFVQFALGGAGVWQRAAATIRNIEQEVRGPQTETKPMKIEVSGGSEQSVSTIFEYFLASVPSLVTAALALLLTVFILLQYRDLSDRALRLMGRGEIGRSIQALDEAGSDLAHFLLLQSALNASFGIFVGVALWVIGIPSPALWGAVAAAMRFVPYVGAFVSAALPMGLAAMVDSGWWMLLETAAVFLVGEPLVGQIIEPLLFGSQTRLSPLAILLGATFWTTLWGPVGLILAVPLTLAIVVMGQHIPHLEFLRILLGNEPVLAPQEQLYHQLLAGEAVEAAKEADRSVSEHTFKNYLDDVIIPAFRIAADDQKRGVLSREHKNQLTGSVATYIELVKESLEFEHEQQMLQLAPKPEPVRRSAIVLILGGRGDFDLAAADLMAEAIRLDAEIATLCPPLGGLTGISAAADADPDNPPEIVVFISVGGVTSGQLRLLLGRVTRTFPGAQIVVGFWGERSDQATPQNAGGEDIRYTDSVASIIDLVRRIADERPPSADGRPRQLDTGPRQEEAATA
jgi:predicted PurR-regulated permease PerM